jgi:uncharacterized protein YegP (UPF0339 family)
MAKFELKKSKDNQFYFSLMADNGQSILKSEMYKTKAACLNGIESVKKNSTEDKRFDQKTAKNGKFHFNLKARNGQIIGTSEMYEAEAGCKNGIASVMKNAAGASTVEIN